MTREQLIVRIRQCPNLPSLPSVAIQVLELAQKQDVDIAEIARIISKDPALSSKILRTVNSSFYGQSQNVSTISHALVILGLQSVKTLVLGFSLVTNLTRHKSAGFEHILYWKRSIFSATAARIIAAKNNLVQQEEAFLASLLRDIGMLVLDQVLGDEYGKITAGVSDHHQLCAVEREALGMDHAQVGQMLAEQWRLPPLLSVPIACHHCPEEVKDPALRKLTELVDLSGRCADVFIDQQPALAIATVRHQCFSRYGMPESEADALLDAIGKRTREVASLFEIHIGSASEYEKILKRANEALIELTLQSQQHATTLTRQNLQLRQKAITDGLTGLANRACFDEFLAQQFARAMAQHGSIGLLIIDVDHFKSINDNHGHQAGDRVLSCIGKLLKTATRSEDLAARYGGEELVLVMPGSTRTTAATIAETIRRAIAAMVVQVEQGSLQITASIGVAVYEPGSPLSQPAALVKAADRALYTAKHAGRNCVRVFALKPPAPAPVPAA